MNVDLSAGVIAIIKEMLSDQKNCHRPEGELCLQCRERQRWATRLRDVLKMAGFAEEEIAMWEKL